MCSKIPRISVAILAGLFLLMPFLLISSCGGGGGGGGGNQGHTLTADGFEKKWDFLTGQSIISSPALASDGTVYIGSNDNYLYALYPNGDLRWKFKTDETAGAHETEGNVFSSPAVGSDGTIYMGSRDTHLYAINPDGSYKWSYPTGDKIFSSPAIDPNSGIIYVGSNDGKLYALYPDGREKWSAELGGWVSSPAVGPDHVIYVGSGQVDWFNPPRSVGSLYAVNPADGHIEWSREISIFSRPAVDSHGIVYAGSTDGRIYALDSSDDGSIVWKYTTGGPVISSPVLGPFGIVYVGSDDAKLYALNPDGSLLWFAAAGDKIRSSAAVGRDGIIYIGCNDRNLYAFAGHGHEGVQKGTFPTFGKVTSIPLIGKDSTIYFGGQDGKVYAVEGIINPS
ncbi:MAG: PQQ-binding-like beta-propeller repeat protein [bacterium]